MLETIEKLLILQDRDRKIHRVQQELAHIGPERESLRAKAAAKSTTPTPAFPSSRRSLFAAGTGPKSRNNCPCWVRDGAMKRSVPALRQ